MDFWQILLKLEKVTILMSMGTEASKFEITLHFMVPFRNCYFIAESGTLLPFSSAFD